MLTRFALSFLAVQVVFWGLSAVELMRTWPIFGGELLAIQWRLPSGLLFSSRECRYHLSGMIKFCLSQDAGNTGRSTGLSSPLSRIRPTFTVLVTAVGDAGTVFEELRWRSELGADAR
jgi:hypothetical protein